MSKEIIKITKTQTYEYEVDRNIYPEEIKNKPLEEIANFEIEQLKEFPEAWDDIKDVYTIEIKEN